MEEPDVLEKSPAASSGMHCLATVACVAQLRSQGTGQTVNLEIWLGASRSRYMRGTS
jgi:hypothetical protein